MIGGAQSAFQLGVKVCTDRDAGCLALSSLTHTGSIAADPA